MFVKCGPYPAGRHIPVNSIDPNALSAKRRGMMNEIGMMGCFPSLDLRLNMLL